MSRRSLKNRTRAMPLPWRFELRTKCGTLQAARSGEMGNRGMEDRIPISPARFPRPSLSVTAAGAGSDPSRSSAHRKARPSDPDKNKSPNFAVYLPRNAHNHPMRTLCSHESHESRRGKSTRKPENAPCPPPRISLQANEKKRVTEKKRKSTYRNKGLTRRKRIRSLGRFRLILKGFYGAVRNGSK